jgi:hypothetical protein
MNAFRALFTHEGIYTLPDGTRMVALWTELGCRPRWWFVAQQGSVPGLRGELEIVVYPNGAIYNFVPEPNRESPEVYTPVVSDLHLEDLRPVNEDTQQDRSIGEERAF